MSLYKFFQRKDKLTVPTLQTCGPSSLTRRQLEGANDSVKRVLVEDGNGELTPSRGHYNGYTAEERAQIGKYAAENGPSKAAKC